MLQLIARVSTPAAAICLALLQLRGEVYFASLWSNTINASVQHSIARASVEIYHISWAAWCFYSSCNKAEELCVYVESELYKVLKAASNKHEKRGYLSLQ